MNTRQRAIRRLRDMLKRRKNASNDTIGARMEREGLASRVKMPVWARTHELVADQQLDVESLRQIASRDWNHVVKGDWD